jgi:hypothetical protein
MDIMALLKKIYGNVYNIYNINVHILSRDGSKNLSPVATQKRQVLEGVGLCLSCAYMKTWNTWEWTPLTIIIYKYVYVYKVCIYNYIYNIHWYPAILFLAGYDENIHIYKLYL